MFENHLSTSYGFFSSEIDQDDSDSKEEDTGIEIRLV